MAMTTNRKGGAVAGTGTGATAVVVKRVTKKKKKKSSLNIKIKPFTKPPSLPPNFYKTSTTVLYSSLRDILNNRQTSGISREELYQKVTDLCSHGFGPVLYLELVDILDAAAFVCVSRLVQKNVDGGTMINQGKKIHYPTPHCKRNESGNDKIQSEIFFTYFQEIDVELNSDMSAGGAPMTLSGGGATSIISDKDNVLLGNIWNVYSDFVQYLDRVLKIFQSLDRMFVYSPPIRYGQHVEEAKVFQRNGGIVGGKENAGVSNASSGIAIGAWNMWDVGINCIYRHMGHIKKEIQNSLDGDTVMEDCISTATTVGVSNTESKSIANMIQYSPLHVLKQRTIACLVQEIKMISQPSALALLRPTPSSLHSKEILHQPTLRNCVSVLRSFTHVAAHRSNAYKNEHRKDGKIDFMGDFLGALVSAATSFLTKESQSFMLLGDATPSNLHMSLLPGKTNYDTRAILHHVDARLKQMSSMTTYYTLSNSPSSSSSDSRTKTISNDSTMGSRNDNRILSHLVETYLLTPHFSTKYILHPANLYPILDDDRDGSTMNVKLLFQLSKRVHTSNDVPSLQEKNFSAITFSPGMELLRISFEMYGKERGLSIMRPNLSPNIAPTPNTSGEAVKPPPPMTSREVQNKIVGNLLGFKLHLEYLHKEAFGCDEYFGKTLRKILEDVLNQGGEVKSSQNHNVLSTTDRRKKSSYRHSGDGCDGGKRIAELLAKYIDQRFKNAKLSLTASPMKGVRAHSSMNRDNDMDAFQSAALDLFRHIQSKDVFEAFYRRDLAKRLLLNKSASIDAERAFVSKLKAECGTGYTSKMEGMFKDMELSRDVMANYSSYLGSLEDISSGKYSNISGTGVDMDVQVLTTGYWPVRTQHPSLILPDSLTARREHFESHYLSKYQGRRIGWQNSLGNCIVKARFPKMSEARELNVNLCQALVLMCFNVEEGADEDPKYTINDIMKKAGLDDRGEAERILQSLSMGREGTQVLRRIDEKLTNKYFDGTSTTPKKKHKVMRKAISDSDVFIFNSNFFNNQRRIRITNIQMKETAEERSKTQEAVTLDRLHLIDAAIVRIMKARKTLDHASLVGEVMKQLKFPTFSTDIKKRIETLIEREYLERTEGDSSRYNYLA